jgi:hypothetical protein
MAWVGSILEKLLGRLVNEIPSTWEDSLRVGLMKMAYEVD